MLQYIKTDKIEELLHLRVILEIEIGRCLRKIKIKNAYQKGLNGSITWVDWLLQPDIDLEPRMAEECVRIAKRFDALKLTPSQIKGIPNRRRLDWALSKHDWKEALLQAKLHSKRQL